ncbi:enoyl-CoA hydratase/isomerase family protein [Stutzerimonas kunmingensis]|uniref:enoyl-CoA hydratase/isomerase family protein n=1 Tax=Stutzerimonas kunmingensis TaxID=1211807 RepID=UPI0028AE6316|nr:enoyl-CoA hydratase/isomerase family protein [Stutzerimonas kunmingensis]
MTYQTLLYDIYNDSIGVVTFNRSSRANAMNQIMLQELADLCSTLSNDDSVRCLVVTGSGDSFNSGFDLKDQAEAMPTGVKEWAPLLEADFKGIMSFWDFPKPTISAINGAALAGGFELMLGCDISIAADNAIFGEPELKFGAGIVAMVLPWFVGPKIAKEIIFTGEDQLSAQRALELGLVNRLVPKEDVLSTALALATKLSRMDPMVIQRTKRAINRTYEIMGMDAALRAALDIDIMIEGEGSDIKREFLHVIREQGLGNALKWRANRY